MLPSRSALSASNFAQPLSRPLSATRALASIPTPPPSPERPDRSAGGSVCESGCESGGSGGEVGAVVGAASDTTYYGTDFMHHQFINIVKIIKISKNLFLKICRRYPSRSSSKVHQIINFE